MGWLKAVGKAIVWVARNETVRNAALAVVKTVIEKKRSEKK